MEIKVLLDTAEEFSLTGLFAGEVESWTKEKSGQERVIGEFCARSVSFCLTPLTLLVDFVAHTVIFSLRLIVGVLSLLPDLINSQVSDGKNYEWLSEIRIADTISYAGRPLQFLFLLSVSPLLSVVGGSSVLGEYTRAQKRDRVDVNLDGDTANESTGESGVEELSESAADLVAILERSDSSSSSSGMETTGESESDSNSFGSASRSVSGGTDTSDSGSSSQKGSSDADRGQTGLNPTDSSVSESSDGDKGALGSSDTFSSIAVEDLNGQETELDPFPISSKNVPGRGVNVDEMSCFKPEITVYTLDENMIPLDLTSDDLTESNMTDVPHPHKSSPSPLPYKPQERSTTALQAEIRGFEKERLIPVSQRKIPANSPRRTGEQAKSLTSELRDKIGFMRGAMNEEHERSNIFEKNKKFVNMAQGTYDPTLDRKNAPVGAGTVRLEKAFRKSMFINQTEIPFEMMGYQAGDISFEVVALAIEDNAEALAEKGFDAGLMWDLSSEQYFQDVQNSANSEAYFELIQKAAEEFGLLEKDQAMKLWYGHVNISEHT